MKILFITNLFPPHHAGTYDLRCHSVAELLRLRGHSVRILTSNHGLNTEQRDGEIERRLLLNGVFGHPLVTGYRPLQDLETHNHSVLRDAITGFLPDIVLVWSLHGVSKSFIYALLNSRLPTVYDVADEWIAKGIREDPWLRWWNSPGTHLARSGLELAGQRTRLDAIAPTRIMKGMDRLPEVYGSTETVRAVPPDSIAAFRFDRLYFCSRALKRTTSEAGFRVNHGDVILPGIPTEHFIGEVKSTPAVKRFLVVSRLDSTSGVMTALQALRLVREKNKQVSLSIYGRGDSDFISQVRSFAVQNALPVEFLTVSNLNRDLATVYQQHDALLYTSEWEEPFARVPLEAMACGLPVIGSLVGGAKDLFRHGENVLTFSPGDVNELASRMQELQLQPALRRQMAETAQTETLGKFSETAMVDQIENYLNVSLEGWNVT